MQIGSFLDHFYNGLFHPLKEYREVGEQETPPNENLFSALVFVLIASGMAPLVQFALGAGDADSLLYDVPFKAVLGLLVWIFISGVAAMMSYIYTGKGRFRTFMTLSGFAALPWFFVAPLVLLKTGIGPIGPYIAMAGIMFIWTWNIMLFALAIGKTYHLTLERVLLVLFMPFIFFMIFGSWVAWFFVNVGHFLP